MECECDCQVCCGCDIVQESDNFTKNGCCSGLCHEPICDDCVGNWGNKCGQGTCLCTPDKFGMHCRCPRDVCPDDHSCWFFLECIHCSARRKRIMYDRTVDKLLKFHKINPKEIRREALKRLDIQEFEISSDGDTYYECEDDEDDEDKKTEKDEEIIQFLKRTKKIDSCQNKQRYDPS